MSEEKRTAGQPTKYKDEYADLAFKFCLLGADNVRLAELFEVSLATIHNWRNAHPEFLDAIKRGKQEADAVIASSLYHRAKGYEHPEDDIRSVNGEIVITPTIKHYPPDTTAAIFWLKNRQNSYWRDRKEHDLTSSDGTMTPKPAIDASKLSDAALAEIMAAKGDSGE